MKSIGFRSTLISLGIVLDRISVVIIAVIATIPVLRPIVTNLGIAGLFLMIGIFIIQGGFTALVKDSFFAEEEKEMEKEMPEVRVRNSLSDHLYVKIVKDN